MNLISSRIANLSQSATMAMNQATRDLKARGVDVINLSVGEPDFNTPEHIKNAAIKAIRENISFYPPAPGFPELRQAVVKKLKRENDLDLKSEQIVVSAGAKNALANVILCLVDKGDEVIIPTPYWVTYAEQVKLAEGENVIIKGTIENDFKVTADQIEKAITPRTKVLLLCSPSNPTGSVYSREELADISRVIERHPRVFVVTDEIYEHINFVGKHETIGQFSSIRDRVVIINGVSKAYAMTGWRIGYSASPEWLAKACTKLQGQLITGATTNAQMAAIEALNGDQSCVAEMLVAFKRRKELIINLLKDIPGLEVSVPEGAFYVFPKIDSYFGKSFGNRQIKSSNDFCMYLLEEGHIGTVPGEAFGDPEGFRISFATSDDKIVEAMKRLKQALARLS
jgi:aspartate aminotransferase